MKNNTRINNRRGFYTIEAAIFLPLVLLAVLSLGYFMRIEGTWESCIHGAVDESALVASRSYDVVNATTIGITVSSRINEDNPVLDSMRISNLRIMYSDGNTNDLTSYKIDAGIILDLPLGFSREFTLEQGIKFRGFTGIEKAADPLGSDVLETYAEQRPVWVFPSSGEKYHSENCTYVKAAVSPKILTHALKRRYDSCGSCKSDNAEIGDIVFCFESEDSAYHIGTCRSIDRHTAVIDKSDADKKGYSPCSKCGGI